MADPCEIGTRQEAHHREMALDNRVRFEGESRHDCEECGNNIPEGRRKLGGVRLCVGCQEVADRRSAQGLGARR